MKPNKEIIKYRKRIPRFIRESSWKVKSLDKSWRKPKGLHSKMRVGKGGKPSTVKVGYRMPNKFRGLHKSGREIKKVSSIDEMKELKPKEVIVEFPSNLGLKKKSELVKFAKENNYYILNINPDKYLSKFESFLEKKQKKRKEIEKRRKELIKAKKEEKKSDDDSKSSDDDKKSKKGDDDDSDDSSGSPKRVKEKSEGEKIKEKVITKSN